MPEVKLKAKVFNATPYQVELEFGRSQVEMEFSSRGRIQRTLKLKEGDHAEIIIRKVK